MLDIEQVRQKIIGALPGAQVSIHDLTGGGDHLQVQVISPDFIGLPMIKRHRLVYAPLQTELHSGQLHALALETLTPDEVRS